MNPTTIDWQGLTHTLNPGYGCKRGCYYCYARDLHNQRMKAKKAGKDLPDFYLKPFTEIQYFPERLNFPMKSKVIKKVFMGSMTDFCYWEWAFTHKVIEACRERPEMTFMFCTKDPGIYGFFNFPLNCWLGTTVTNNSDLWRDSLLSAKNHENMTFLSIEPLLGPINADLTDTDLIIVGADSRKGAKPPKKEWIESINHPNIHWKKNIKEIMS